MHILGMLKEEIKENLGHEVIVTSEVLDTFFSHLKSFSCISGLIHNAVFPYFSLPTPEKTASLEWTPCDFINHIMARRHD